MSESSLPPPPRTSGSGGLIGAGLAMLLAIGALLLWKNKGSEPGAPVVDSHSAQSPPPAVLPPALNAPPPPPPPPEEEVVAELEKAPASPKPRAAPEQTPCSGTCTGSAPAALKASLQGRAFQARGCYQQALRQGSASEGRLVVAVRVSSAGGACSVSLKQNTLGDPAVTTCVLAKFRSGTYPKPEGGCVDTEVPINFVSKPQ